MAASGDDVVRLARAYAFAAEHHTGHWRKGRAREPFTDHLIEVAALVAEATGGADPDLVVAAVLHDVVEDTPVTAEEVRARFGADVTALVLECTDDKSLPKAERKRLQVATAPAKSRRAGIVKLADKTSNVRALRVSPPDDWPDGRKREYLRWAREVVAGLRGASPWLEERFDEAACELERALGG